MREALAKLEADAKQLYADSMWLGDWADVTERVAKKLRAIPILWSSGVFLGPGKRANFLRWTLCDGSWQFIIESRWLWLRQKPLTKCCPALRVAAYEALPELLAWIATQAGQRQDTVAALTAFLAEPARTKEKKKTLQVSWPVISKTVKGR